MLIADGLHSELQRGVTAVDNGVWGGEKQVANERDATLGVMNVSLVTERKKGLVLLSSCVSS